MPTLRTTDRLDPDLAHDCDRMQIDGYSLREVLAPGQVGVRAATNGGAAASPAFEGDRGRTRAIEITIRGRNFWAVAQPLTAYVGEVPVSYLRIAPDERSIEGLLLEEPADGARVRVILGDVDAVQHARPYDAAGVDRMG
jgi:hypothetical protein